MRKLILLAFLLSVIPAFPQTSAVTGHLVDPGNVATASRTFVRFELTATGGNICRISANGLVAPTLKDFNPNSNGLVSFNIIRNDQLVCGSTTGASRWKYTIFRDGKPSPSCFLNVTSATLNLDSTACLNATATPVTTAPTDSVYARIDGTNAGFTGPVTFGSSLTVTGASTLSSVDNRIYIDGNKYPITQAGIQQALTDACTIGNGNGTEIYLPVAGTVTLSNTTGQQFTSTCPVRMHGSIMGSFWFVVATGVPNTVPTFLIKPSGANTGFWEFDHFRMTTNNLGATGGDWFFLDSTNGSINDLQLHHLSAGGQSTTAWFLNMNATVVDRYFRGNVYENNQIEGGINFNSTSVADNWIIAHNEFGSPNANTNPCVNGTIINGASHLIVAFNHGGCKGGEFISHGVTECQILYNQWEQPSASTEANSAMIDLIGDTYAIDHCDIIGNNLGSANLANINVRLNSATNTVLSGNVFGVNTTAGSGVTLTATPTGTYIDPNTNEFILGGTAVAVTNGAAANPFLLRFPKADGTLSAQIRNATDGGLLFCTNANACWTLVNGGTLFSPSAAAGGGAIGLNGSTSGLITISPTAIAGSNTLTLPATTDTIAVLGTFAAPPAIGATTPAAGTFTTLKATSGVGGASSAGIQHGRVTTGSIGAASRADVTLTWTTAFANTSYTPVCQMIDTSAAGIGMRVERIRTVNAGSLVVQVVNDAAGALTGTLSCMAMHD